MIVILPAVQSVLTVVLPVLWLLALRLSAVSVEELDRKLGVGLASTLRAVNLSHEEAAFRLGEMDVENFRKLLNGKRPLKLTHLVLLGPMVLVSYLPVLSFLAMREHAAQLKADLHAELADVIGKRRA